MSRLDEPEILVRDCGAQHFKLAIWIIGITSAVIGGLTGIGISRLEAYESRLREVEQRTVRIEVTLNNIDSSLTRLEKNWIRYWDTHPQGGVTP
jgi:hypothetical protein